MTQTTSDNALQKATGKTWDQWYKLLDEAGAQALPHPAIVRWLHGQNLVTSGWWRQAIAVGYERHIGRRKVGQVGEHNYQISVTKTLLGSLDDALEQWLALVSGVTSFNSLAILAEPTITKTDNWRYWRTKLADGTRVVVTIGIKDAQKSQLAISHEKIASKTAADGWKAYWKAFLDRL